MTPSAPTQRLLETLIAFPTVSRDSNLGLIEWVRDELAAQGIRCRLTYDNERRKANLFATLAAGDASGGIVLSGHTDVVPVDGQDWSRDPFKPAIIDGKVYGRGSADMKGFIAVVLAAVPEMIGKPFHLALSYDEEVGCLGAPRLLEDLRSAGIRPEGCIVGEPTGMALVNGHKGASVHRCKLLGRAAHSARAPQGVNAIAYAAKLITRIEEIAARLRESEKRHPGYDITHTTLNIGVITGGVASNIVAERCEFRFDIRHLPWTQPSSIIGELETFAAEELLPEMRGIAPEASITFDLVGAVPALATDASAPLVTRVARLLAAASPNQPQATRPAATARNPPPLQHQVAPVQVGFGTEAGLFAAAGIPAVICGPGSISQAHRPDEFVTLEQLARCEHFLDALIEESACH
ncbi:MAG TPA: acetylornithine deacetylase [Steroidobacteraceae bacterium]|nr:acetylornithine deacetylase [Steroidobacteraceae bacterium]